MLTDTRFTLKEKGDYVISNNIYLCACDHHQDVSGGVKVFNKGVDEVGGSADIHHHCFAVPQVLHNIHLICSSTLYGVILGAT